MLQHYNRFSDHRAWSCRPLTFPATTFALILMLSLQIAPTSANYTITSNSAQQCQVCDQAKQITCTYINPPNLPLSLNSSNCQSYCCNSLTFANAAVYPLCQETASSTAAGVGLTSLIIILVFSLVISFCLVYSLRSCIRRYREEQGKEGSPSNMDLAAYNIDELGPLYQNKTQNCSICLDNSCNIRTKCGHSYHSQCLGAWTVKQQKCPLCLTSQFNPIVLYCTACSKQSKLAILRGSFQFKQKEVWLKYQQFKCESCLSNNQDEVSLNIQLSEKDKVEPQHSASNIASQAYILQ